MLCVFVRDWGCSVYILLLLSALSVGQETSPDRQAQGPTSHSDVICGAKAEDYPVGIYLGPSRLTSAYYTADDEPVMIADVPADEDWHGRALDRILHGQRICWDWVGDRDEEAGPCEAILSSFLANMKALSKATSDFLGRDFQIGFVVIPNNLEDYTAIIDQVMHIAFNFTHNPQPDDDLLYYDVHELPVGAQYGYNFIDPRDRYGSTVPPPNRHGPPVPSFNDDDYLLYVNIEDDFLEVGFRCLTFWCWVPKTRKIVAIAGHDSTGTLLTQFPADAETNERPEHVWTVRPPTSVEFGNIIAQLANYISEFLHDTGFTGEDGGVLRGVVLAGGASPEVVTAAIMALPYAMPDIDPAMFLTTKDPAYVPSLGAALMARNVVVEKRRDLEATFCGLYGL
ncbi:hypothetical protein GQ53DRAFT_813457 [Thozetella sp. PMI_491]|nr:hypothetical protein GQ53DRAFT_813457 [Thozetella sp. PMI_491]